MSAKETSNMGAAAKRSATIIQRLTRCLDDLSVADRNTLIDAAEILLKHGKRAQDKAGIEKRTEIRREKAQDKARAEARQIIAGWPQTTTLDRIAMIHATRDGAERLSRGKNERDPRWELDYATNEAKSDIVSDAVMHAVPYSARNCRATTAAVPVSDHMARVRELADKIRIRSGMGLLAAEWDARLTDVTLPIR